MILRKRGFPRQSIKAAEPGQLEWTAGLFFLLFLGVFLCGTLQLEIFRASAGYLEDALAASNLASAVIDVKEYGCSHTVLIEKPCDAYETYLLALRGNLNLDEEWENHGTGLISGPVRVLNYTVYNVRGNRVRVYSFDENGVLSQREGLLGSVQAPNGKEIGHTSVYSEVTYPVDGILGVQAQARMGKLADVVGEK